MEHLYYKKKVAELKKDLLRPENTSDNSKFTFSCSLSFVSVFFVMSFHSEIVKCYCKRGGQCISIASPFSIIVRAGLKAFELRQLT